MIENNQYAMAPAGGGHGRAVSPSAAPPSTFPANRLTACDVEAVREAGARPSRGRARAAGPTILEMRTERYRGHSLADPAKYRRKDEARAAHAPDPVERARKRS